MYDSTTEWKKKYQGKSYSSSAQSWKWVNEGEIWFCQVIQYETQNNNKENIILDNFDFDEESGETSSPTIQQKHIILYNIHIRTRYRYDIYLLVKS